MNDHYRKPYGHGNPYHGPDVYTALPARHTTPESEEAAAAAEAEQRRQAAAYIRDYVTRTGGTSEETATYYAMLFDPADLEEMGL